MLPQGLVPTVQRSGSFARSGGGNSFSQTGGVRSSSGTMGYQTGLPTFGRPSGDTTYNAPEFNDRASEELWNRIGAGAFDVTPVDPYKDAFILSTMSGIQAEGRRAGEGAGNQLLRQIGGAGRQQASLLGLIGESQGIRDANQMALEEGRFRTGVLEGNADRGLSALTTLGGLDIDRYRAGIDSERARLGFLGQDLAERNAAFDAGLALRGEERATDQYGWESGYRERQEDRLARQFEQDLAQDADLHSWAGERQGWEREEFQDAQSRQNEIDALLRQYQENNQLRTTGGGYDNWLTAGASLTDMMGIRARLAALGVDVGGIPTATGGYY